MMGGVCVRQTKQMVTAVNYKTPKPTLSTFISLCSLTTVMLDSLVALSVPFNFLFILQAAGQETTVSRKIKLSL